MFVPVGSTQVHTHILKLCWGFRFSGKLTEKISACVGRRSYTENHTFEWSAFNQLLSVNLGKWCNKVLLLKSWLRAKNKTRQKNGSRPKNLNQNWEQLETKRQLDSRQKETRSFYTYRLGNTGETDLQWGMTTRSRWKSHNKSRLREVRRRRQVQIKTGSEDESTWNTKCER